MKQENTWSDEMGVNVKGAGELEVST